VKARLQDKMRLEDMNPQSVNDAIIMLYDNLTEGEVRSITTSKPEEHHHFIGRALRNCWMHSRPDSPLVQDCLKTYGVSMPDDVSALILEGLWAAVHDRGIDLHAIADGFRAHWIESGCDPETGQPR
jgi:hypothetical protein